MFNKSVNDIQSLGIFKKVEAEIYEGSNSSLKEIDLELAESPTGEIALTAGFGTPGETLGGGIREITLGKGIRLDTNIELTQLNQRKICIF